jgi:hypothetical protein
MDWVKQLPTELIDFYDSKNITSQHDPKNTLHLMDPLIDTISAEQELA